jgi:hypothetical protein
MEWIATSEKDATDLFSAFSPFCLTLLNFADVWSRP